MTYATVFYAGQVLIELESEKALRTWGRSTCFGCPEFYNGGYIYCRDVFRYGWGRPDLTLLLLKDVPKELRVLQLILN
jgi:hypothetical protein